MRDFAGKMMRPGSLEREINTGRRERYKWVLGGHKQKQGKAWRLSPAEYAKQERLYREPWPFRKCIKIMDLGDQKLP